MVKKLKHNLNLYISHIMIISGLYLSYRYSYDEEKLPLCIIFTTLYIRNLYLYEKRRSK